MVTMGSKIYPSKFLAFYRPATPRLQPPVRRIGWNGKRPTIWVTPFSPTFSLKILRWNCSARGGGVSVEEMLSIGDSQKEREAPQELQGCIDKVYRCNRGSEKKSEFLPFIVEKNIIGYIHLSIVEHLEQFGDIFTLESGVDNNNDLLMNETYINRFVTLHHQLRTADERTDAVGVAVKWLNKAGVILGLRNELCPVGVAFGAEPLLYLERAAMPYFGAKAYGVHMNGYVIVDGEKSLWIAKRSETKSTYPGMLDHLVAGGMPAGITCKENLIKECNEEAGIPRNVAERATPVGVVSYEDIDGNRFKRDVLFCYDLLLAHDFQPTNTDGEVETFMLVPVSQVAKVVCKTKLFKPNCALVIIDFLFRHGYVSPDQRGYLDLLQSLRRGESS